MASRSKRAETARETLEILESGHYLARTGNRVTIGDRLAAARTRSILYTPDRHDDVSRQCEPILLGCIDRAPTAFEVVNATTLHASRELLRDDPSARVLALNFASAKNPGGGFLNGSQAQEESLARASGLYACIAPLQAMYEANRGSSSCLYTEHMIYSPDVPVFRDDDDTLLEEPYAVSFVTAPAVNAGVVREKEPRNVARIEPVMLARIEKVLSLAVVNGHDVLVLGAWGCGVFRNDPAEVAVGFARHLNGEGRFRSAFRKVVFAVLDRTHDRSIIGPFEGRLSTASP
ncbi:MAG: TIGR02452 family protein [Isosphaeraceae bacterium]